MLSISETKAEAGRKAAGAGADVIRRALVRAERAYVVLATGASQFELLEALAAAPGIPWGRVEAFHLDEYIGLPATHPASFRRYLRERFLERLPEPPAAFHGIDAERDPEAACEALGSRLDGVTVDVAFVGIGENGHLAFNDPPADFETEEPYLVVRLDEACRRQQLGEGWFGSLEEVPDTAVSMSVRQILKARTIVCTVPEARKARALRDALEGPVTPDVPASILQTHPDCRFFLDRAAAGLLGSSRFKVQG